MPTILNDATGYLFSSKTLILWIMLALMAFIVFLISIIILLAFGQSNPYIGDILDFFKVVGGGGTLRNVVSDGIMPRIPQTVGAVRDPSVSTQSPQSMTTQTTTQPDLSIHM